MKKVKEIGPKFNIIKNFFKDRDAKALSSRYDFLLLHQDIEFKKRIRKDKKKFILFYSF